MTEAPEAVRPMEGGGAYNRSSGVQAAGILSAVALLEEAARAVPLAGPPEAIVIADYGASEGKNSLLPLATTVRAVRGAPAPIERSTSSTPTCQATIFPPCSRR